MIDYDELHVEEYRLDQRVAHDRVAVISNGTPLTIGVVFLSSVISEIITSGTRQSCSL